MSVATSTAIAIGLGGASVAGSLYGAHKQAGTAKEAAKTQSAAATEAARIQAAAAEQARQLQERMYLQTRTDLSPYMQGGSQGLSALTSLLGVSGLAPTAGLAPMAPPMTPQTGLGGPVAGPGRTMPPGAVQTGAYAVPRPGATPASQSAYGQAPGGTVLLRAPTGQVQPVPAEQAEFFLARGATRV
jgi:hypothetical protein